MWFLCTHVADYFKRSDRPEEQCILCIRILSNVILNIQRLKLKKHYCINSLQVDQLEMLFVAYCHMLIYRTIFLRKIYIASFEKFYTVNVLDVQNYRNLIHLMMPLNFSKGDSYNIFYESRQTFFTAYHYYRSKKKSFLLFPDVVTSWF